MFRKHVLCFLVGFMLLSFLAFFVLFVFALCLVCRMLLVALDCPLLIAHLVFSSIYLGRTSIYAHCRISLHDVNLYYNFIYINTWVSI